MACAETTRQSHITSQRSVSKPGANHSAKEKTGVAIHFKGWRCVHNKECNQIIALTRLEETYKEIELQVEKKERDKDWYIQKRAENSLKIGLDGKGVMI